MSDKESFPRVDRSVFSVGSLFDESEDRAYWHSKTPLERLAALELNRQAAYGYDPSTSGFQRFFEVVELQRR